MEVTVPTQAAVLFSKEVRYYDILVNAVTETFSNKLMSLVSCVALIYVRL